MSFRGAASQAATWESLVTKERKMQDFLSIQEEIATGLSALAVTVVVDSLVQLLNRLRNDHIGTYEPGEPCGVAILPGLQARITGGGSPLNDYFPDFIYFKNFIDITQFYAIFILSYNDEKYPTETGEDNVQGTHQTP